MNPEDEKATQDYLDLTNPKTAPTKDGGNATANLTIRDAYAIAAMHSMISNGSGSFVMAELIKDAFDIADSAIEARSK